MGSGSRTATCPQQPTDRLVIAFDSVSAACVPACPPDMSPPSMKVASFFRMSSSSSFAAVVAAVIADDAIDDAPHELERSKSIDDDVLPLTAAAFEARTCSTAFFIVLFGMSAFDSRASPLTGSVSWSVNHATIALRSYVFPAVVSTGSTKSSFVSGQCISDATLCTISIAPRGVFDDRVVRSGAGDSAGAAFGSGANATWGETGFASADADVRSASFFAFSAASSASRSWRFALFAATTGAGLGATAAAAAAFASSSAFAAAAAASAFAFSVAAAAASAFAAADAIEAGAGTVSGAAAGLGAAAFDDRSMCAGGGGGSSGSDGFVAVAAAAAPRFFFGASASALCANFGCPHLHVPKTAAVMSMRYSSHAAMAVWWSALPGESSTIETPLPLRLLVSED